MIALVGAAGTAAAQPDKPDGDANAKPSAQAEPPADEPSPGDPSAVDALRQEYQALRDELFESRARAATVASQLYSTKVALRLTWASARMYGVSRATIRLDGASVYDNTTGAIANDDGIRFAGFIAPGRHVVTIRIEAGGKDDARFASAVESTVVVHSVAGKDLFIVGRASDDGDIAFQWKKKEQGTYKLRLDIDVKSIARRPAPKEEASASKKH